MSAVIPRRHLSDPLNPRPDEPADDPPIAGIIQRYGQKIHVFRSDEGAPPVDRAAIAQLWKREPLPEDEKRRLIDLIAQYRVWFDAFLEITEEIRKARDVGSDCES